MNHIMYLIEYLIQALNPTTLIQSEDVTEFPEILTILSNLKITPESTIKWQYFDLIIRRDFNVGMCQSHLTYDGLYITRNKPTDVAKYEWISYQGYYLIKKSSFIPFFKLTVNPYGNVYPIIMRNFGSLMNITPKSPPYEIIDHPAIIQHFCTIKKIDKYLELGIRRSPVFHRIRTLVGEAHGVDMSPCAEYTQKFYHMSTDEFFSKNTLKFDMIFVDACHDIDFVKRDFENGLSCLNPGGMIIFHDTYPANEFMTQHEYCSDSYKIVAYIKSSYPELECFNMPICPGLCIVKAAEV